MQTGYNLFKKFQKSQKYISNKESICTWEPKCIEPASIQAVY
jgi:hypothetical protein